MSTRTESRSATNTVGRIATALYGTVAYVLFFFTFCYAVGFLNNAVVPKGIDAGEPGPFWPALLINVALMGLFGLQHSVMARPGFKKQWTRIIPKSIERSTFVLATVVCFGLLFWQWRPLPETVWSVDDPVGRAALVALHYGGWVFALLATMMVSHFDLFGLRQAFTYSRGREYRPIGFRVVGFYKYMRHPIMAGFLTAFWVTPDMTQGRLLFAVVVTAYVMVALQFEERDLVHLFGAQYRNYQRRVYSLIPFRKYPAPARGAAEPSQAMGD